MKGLRTALLVGVASAAMLPQAAYAQTKREAELEARLRRLEQSMVSLQSELQQARAEQAAARDAAAAVAAKPASGASVAVAAAPGATAAPAASDGFRVGNTTFKLGGFIKTTAMFSRWSDGDVAGNALGRDFYLPQQIPLGGTRESIDNDWSAKQTRLTLSVDSPVDGNSLKGYLEADFQTSPGTQGSERTTNGYTLALRRAYVQFNSLAVGQDWSNFQYVGALPESTDFVGPTEGTIFVRQPLVRYGFKLDEGLSLSVAAENGETASSMLGNAALVENDDDRFPDLTARLQYTAAFGELSGAGLIRQLAVDNGAAHDDAFAWGVSGAGRIYLNQDKSSDVRFMATYGQGIGRYVGLNFAPDAVVDPVTNRMKRPDIFAIMGAVRIPLTTSVRANVMAGYQNVDYPGYAPALMSTFNSQAWSVAGNLFWSPVNSFDLGVEYRRGSREVLSGDKGHLDRIEFVAKYGF